MIITLDGPSGVGKTTIAQEFVKRYAVENAITKCCERIFFLSSGMFYRIVALSAKESLKRISKKEREITAMQVLALVEQDPLFFVHDIEWNDTRPVHRLLSYKNDESYYRALYDLKTSDLASFISAYRPLREALNEKMRTIIRHTGAHWFVEGRDAGDTIVYNPTLSVYLDAPQETRALRRATQNSHGHIVRVSFLKKIEKAIQARDDYDTRKGAYNPNPRENMLHINTAVHSIEQTCEKIYNSLQRDDCKSLRLLETSCKLGM